ncbi:MerR family transcriptional regulator [Gemmatimonadota bacterium]
MMNKVNKVYYSISEVAEMAGLEQHVLRYWETEFPQLRPLKNRGGNRAYRDKDIKLLFLIKKLLHHDRFTIEGARRQLMQTSESNLEQMELSFEEVKALDMLRTVREEVRDILELMDDLPGEVTRGGARKSAKTGAKSGSSSTAKR